MLAKRRRKKKSIGTALKFEVYGILIITLSVIALSGQGWPVDKGLANFFAVFLGEFYFVVPLIGIYVGLMTMILRKWPSNWRTQRKLGLLLFLLGFMLMYTIRDVDQKLGPIGVPISWESITAHGQEIGQQALPWGDYYDTPIAFKALSGGMIGAYLYGLLFVMFGSIGARLIMIVTFLISVMLVTGKSYVDLARIVRAKGGKLVKLLKLKFASGRPRTSAKAAPVQPANNSVPDDDDEPPIMLLDDDDLLDDDEPFTAPSKPARKKPAFFAWVSGDKRQEAEPPQIDSASDEQPMDELPPLEGIGDWQQSAESSWQGSAEAPAPDDGGLPPWEQPAQLEPAPVWPDALEPAGGAAIGQLELPIDEEAESLGAASGAADGAASVAEAMPGAALPKPSKPYLLPPMSLLARPQQGKGGPADTGEAKRKLEATLESFGVKANVLDVVRGPAVTRYEVQPATGVKVSRIVSLTDDIALALAAKDIRMEAPIPGKSAIGIEVPNTEVSMVTMREVMETPAFQAAPSKLSIAFGRDISGQPIVGNLARMPHLLVAGATGSGKSVCINGIITSILYKAAPDEVKFLMVDPKMVELNMYNGIPHLLAPVVTDPRRASLALKKIVVEMEKRYERFSKSGTRNIEGYNTLMKDNPQAVLPYIVVIVDELADLMMVAANDVEDAITRLAQMARAAGIHLIIATQRPSVDVITGVIKANIPSRIAFGVSSQVDSRTILDMVGAEKLLGRGDMLFLPVGMSKPIRVQGAFLSDQEVEAVVQFAREQAEAEYKEDLVPEIEESSSGDQDDLDELFDQAVQIVLEAKQASVSLLQRRMRVGYTRAARLIDQMEARGIVGPYEGSKPREVLLTPDQIPSGKLTS